MSISIENQEMADKRLPCFLDAPLKHREVFCSPLISSMSLGKYLDTGLIQCVNVGGEKAVEYERTEKALIIKSNKNFDSDSPICFRIEIE